MITRMPLEFTPHVPGVIEPDELIYLETLIENLPYADAVPVVQLKTGLPYKVVVEWVMHVQLRVLGYFMTQQGKPHLT